MSITKTTIVVYKYSGSTSELTIPFDYLKREFVVVSLGGDGKPQKALKLGTDYRFATKTTIIITRPYQADEGYTKVIVRRVTDASKRIINYQDGSILNASELNTSQLQALHVAEEARDLANYTLFVDNDNNLDARGRKIINLGDPANPQDAVTKKYVDTASESVIDSRNKALQYRNEAEEFKNQSQGFRNEAETFKNTADRKATEISNKIAKADELNNQAVSNSNKAQQYATSAQQSASAASQAEKNAQASDKNAAKSAADAKLWASQVKPELLVHKSDIKQELGDSTEYLMSQKAIKDTVGTIITVDNMEILKGLNLQEGTIVRINGWSQKGDCSQHTRVIKNTNDGTGHSLANGKFAIFENKGEVDPRWFGAKGDGNTNDTTAFTVAIKTFKGHYGGTVLLDKGKFLLDGLVIDKAGLVFRGSGNKVSRLTCKTLLGITVRPLIAGSPFTNSGHGGIFFENCQLYADSEEARNNGVGLRLQNCFVTNCTNLYVSGFKKNIELVGCHYNSFTNFYGSDEKDDTYPNKEIFNRGYAISISKEDSSGEHQSTGTTIDGGWLHNTSLDLENSEHVYIRNIDIEPASNSVLVGRNSIFEGCRFERMDYYAIEGKYPRFSWFIIKKDGNTFVNNTIHSLGAHNEPFTNPKFLVESNFNKFDFTREGVRYGLITFKNTTKGNEVTVGTFNDYKKFSSTDSNYICESNSGVYEGDNTYTLKESTGFVTSYGLDYEVKGCSSIKMPNRPFVHNLNKSGNTYTVSNSDSTQRIVFNFNIKRNYEVGTYCIKFKYKTSKDMSIYVYPSLTSKSSVQIKGLKQKGKYIFVRFIIPEGVSLEMNPVVRVGAPKLNDSFELSEIELLKFDGGRYIPINNDTLSYTRRGLQ